ncbi:hypothetical protein [Phenylobacterium sp.]|uniref:hypothetical protein n=1 Tax=Phenylobacterium sp. TaxID=1871053 RepID=UPI003BA9A085
MTAKKKAPPRDEDPAQSKRFLDLASELEAAGDLNPTEGEEAFERLVGKALPIQSRKTAK